MSLAWLKQIQKQLELLAIAWEVPLGVAVGWIQAESGGRLGEVTRLDERGYFQLLPEESKDLGIDHQRLSTDAIYSLAQGFRLVDYYSHQVDRFAYAAGLRVEKGSEYHWRLAKLAHSIGQGACKQMIIQAARLRLEGWTAFATYFLAHDAEYTAKFKHSPVKWIGLVDRVFEIGRPYGLGSTPKPGVATISDVKLKRLA